MSNNLVKIQVGGIDKCDRGNIIYQFMVNTDVQTPDLIPQI
jgi:hypothetical protein